MKNKLRGLFLATAALISFNAHSATITVDSNADTGTAGCTLRNAIKSANSNTNNGGCTAGDAGVDTIQFNADMTITLTNGAINITEPLNIDGQANAIIVDGNNASRIFVIPSAGDDTSINALTLQNGNSTEGGAIYSDSDLIISNSSVSNNTASNYGGAIAGGGTITISTSTFSGNRATTFGGAIHANTATINSSTFSGNSANVNGGAIRVVNTITISTSTFSGNSANIFGGAIHANTATINSSTFSGNSATSGGAIFAETADISTNNFSDNSANANGGAINANGGAINASTAAISNSTFSGNSADDGGVIYTANTAIINSSILLNNTAPSAQNCAGTITGTNNLFETGAGCGTGTETTLAEVLVTSGGNAVLADNGCTPAQATPAGCTHTIALLASTSNPAIDAGSAGGLTTDQRGYGFVRPIDIGAFELQAPQYSITYDENGGSAVTPNPANYFATQAATLPTPTRTGYTFVSWQNGGTPVSSPFTMPANDVTLTVQWKQIVTSACGTANGIATLTAPTVNLCTSGTASAVDETTEPSKFTWTCNGTNVNKTCEAPRQYTLSYDTVGGNTVASINVTAGDTPTLPSPTRTGFTFDGWVNSGTAVTSPFTMPTSNTKLTAKWTATGTNPPPLTNTTSSIPALSPLALLALISILGSFAFIGRERFIK